MPVSRYMALCLGHPQHGYYMNRDPFGTRGDFVTAPEISQMFGELLGLWCSEVWRTMGSPKKLSLVELGPGRGTLMRDLLRAAKVAPEFRAGLEVHFVEMSEKLRGLQRDLLQLSDVPLHWHHDVNSLPNEPLIVIANEFLDALPIDQYIKLGDGWHEWRVGIADDQLVFGASPVVLPAITKFLPTAVIAGTTGTIFERRDLGPIQGIAHRIADHGGAALFIDYGHLKSAAGDTLQAIGSHKFTSPLENPGEADVTSHVDFEALAEFARKQGTKIHGPVTQGFFLKKLGIDVRTKTLKQDKNDKTVEEIEAARERLTGPGRGMGELFKVMALAHPSLPPLPGFDSPTGGGEFP